MKTIVVGSGIQGQKRRKICGDDFVAFVDPYNKEAEYNYFNEVPPDLYEAACVCTPNKPKWVTINGLIELGKHVLVEKPLWAEYQEAIKMLQYDATKKGVVLYTAYNHRFEPSIVHAKRILANRMIGKPYYCRLYYGNGTARNVRGSWKDKDDEIGIIGEIGSHLLDMLNFLFDGHIRSVELDDSYAFENNTPDMASFRVDQSGIIAECHVTYLSWKNEFHLNIVGDEGSLRVTDFCKWGKSDLVWSRRVYPSGVPKQSTMSWQDTDDPTWLCEWIHFKELIKNKEYVTGNDLEINYAMNRLLEQSWRKNQWRSVSNG